MAVSNGTGQGGKSFQDRQLAADVRTLALERIQSILKGKRTKLRDAVILKLAGTVLPRLNEHMGEGGGAISVEISETVARKNGLARL